MKIVQSFALFEKGSPYLQKGRGSLRYMLMKKDTSYVYLNFYSALLSFITLKVRYGHVTMYCNQIAYDTLFKYIPYDEIVIMENENGMDFWNKYKLDVIKTIGEDFIHVDPDVFIFSNFFDEFIKGDGDILVQDIVPAKNNLLAFFARENVEFLKEIGAMTWEYDGRAISGGVLGMKKHTQAEYFRVTDLFYCEMMKFIKDNGEGIKYQSLILEELMLYLVAIENDYKILDVLPYDLILKHGIEKTGDIVNYVHLWRKTKFKPKYIKMIRKIIKNAYSQYQEYIEKYDEVIKRRKK